MKVLLLLTCLIVVKANVELELLTAQFANYPDIDRHVRPVENVSHPVMVEVSFYPTEIVGFEAHGGHSGYGTLQLAGPLLMMWADSHLGWEPSNYEGIQHISVPAGLMATRMWQPDIVPFDGAPWGEYTSDGVIFTNGGVLTSQPTVLAFNCVPDHWGETTSCTATLGSWTHTSPELDLDGTPRLGMDEFRTHPEWVVVHSSATRVEKSFESYEGVYVLAEFSITLTSALGPFYTLHHHHHHHSHHH